MDCTTDFYNEKYEFYLSYICKDHSYERNGFDEYPMCEYSVFVQAINSLPIIKEPVSIIDIGCGNALLLKHLYDELPYSIIPYGVDFLYESILDAKEQVFPCFSNNFICNNIKNITLPINFDVIIFGPSLLMSVDRQLFINQMTEAYSHYCILYTYSDVLVHENIENVMDFISLSVKNVENGILFKNQTDQISLVVIDLFKI